MLITIHFPDALPKETLNQYISDFEESLRKEASRRKKDIFVCKTSDPATGIFSSILQNRSSILAERKNKAIVADLSSIIQEIREQRNGDIADAISDHWIGEI
ncbi:MAG: hypothetical protein AB7S75_09750 [Desulfococcaceae bacterium]